jgi:hypothetical protein
MEDPVNADGVAKASMQLRPRLNKVKTCYGHVLSTSYFGFPPKPDF